MKNLCFVSFYIIISAILNLLEKRNYIQDKQPFIFSRMINSESGNPVTVKINLLAGEYGGTGKLHRTQKVQDVRPRKARGCDLVFDHSFSVLDALNIEPFQEK